MKVFRKPVFHRRTALQCQENTQSRSWLRYVPKHPLLILVLAVAPAMAFADAESAASTDDSGYTVAAPAAWVDVIAPFETATGAGEDDGDGYQWHLTDKQINAIVPGHTEYYVANEFRVLTPDSVTDNSQISVTFDPSHSSITMHNLLIEREGEVLDKLASTPGRVLQREAGLESLSFSGNKTVSFLLEDVRPGDIIHWSYTSSGDNPVLQGHREFAASRVVSSDVDRLRTRVLSPAANPLQVRYEGEPLLLLERTVDDVHESVLDLTNLEGWTEPDDTPAWRSGYHRVVFSSIRAWADVVQLEGPFYRAKPGEQAELVKAAATIRETHARDEARIGAALRWVQSEIRYYAVSLGENSHRPATPAETLSRRYGDCKAKTLLLIELLAELGIKADAALVSTDMELVNTRQPYRLHTFDHVIVHVAWNGVDHWLDPTDSPQIGALGEFGESDYGHALILAAGSDSLTPMANASHHYVSVTENHLVLTDAVNGKATLMVNNRRTLQAAEWRRTWKTGASADDLTESRQSSLRGMFPGLKASRDAEIDVHDTNVTVTREYYDIEGFWQTHLTEGNRRKLLASSIWLELNAPSDAWFRTTPYELTMPSDVRERWTIELAERPETGDAVRTINTPYFQFERTMRWDAYTSTLAVEFHIRLLVREVPTNDIRAYYSAVAQAESLSIFSLKVPDSQVAVAWSGD